jgi:GMP reductase
MKDLKVKVDFDNILVTPKINTEITSRYKDVILPETLPLFTAPMDTVVNLNNIDTFMDNKINITLPRTIKYDEFRNRVRNENMQFYSNIFISMGFKEIEEHHKTNFSAFHENAHISIDVANGHMQKIMDFAKEIKRLRPDIILMVGNIANPKTYTWYAENKCVDYIRIGIGNGGGCLTTKQSGVGFPMASLIYEIRQEKLLYVYDHHTENDFIFPPAIVADGGMKDYVDVIKALALGADFVMIGSIFNKAFESCAPNYLYGVKINKRFAEKLFDNGYPIKKYFRGMSTKAAQKAMGKTTFKTSEGIVTYRKVEYHLQGWIENFEHYLRNTMSFSNAKTLKDFIGMADICRITDKGYDRFNK